MYISYILLKLTKILLQSKLYCEFVQESERKFEVTYLIKF
jgi:hypothetical protein